MLTFQETVWSENNGYKTRKVQVRIESIQASETIKEQSARIEKISLVVFLNNEQKKILMKIGRQLKRNDSDFYQNSNLHVTVLGLGPLAKASYKAIQKKIQDFAKRKKPAKLTVAFNTIRPGTMYSNDIKINTISGLSNGTVVALGDINSNKEFCEFVNELVSFLLKDEKIKSALGANFRKKLPSLWCTLGYYNSTKKFNISHDLETIFKQYTRLTGNSYKFSVTEISLVKSRYKNLGYFTLLHKFKL